MKRFSVVSVPTETPDAADSTNPATAASHIPIGGGDMATRIRGFDWTSTTLDAPENWPIELRTALGLCIGAGFPAALLWGGDNTIFYNDAWRPIAGHLHPVALGRSARDIRPVSGDWVMTLCEQVRLSGEARTRRNQLICQSRHDSLEECYFNFTFNPVPNTSDGIGGILITATETTDNVINARRGRLLRELDRLTTAATSSEHVCALAADVLSAGGSDVPFCLIYLFDGPDEAARLAGLAGLQPDTAASPSTISLRQPGSAWPLRRMWATGRAEIVADVGTRFGIPLPGGIWPEPVRIAVAAPIVGLQQGRLAGVMLVGLSPRRPLDESYRGFIDRAAAQISVALGRTRTPLDQRRRWVRHRQRRHAPFGAHASGALADFSPPLPARRQHVLIASREALSRSSLQALLANSYDVITASDSAEVHAAIEKRLPDLLLLDASASHEGAIDLLAEVQAHENSRALPVILLSDQSRDEDRALALEAGADDYLVKPVSANGLMASVAHNLKLAQLRVEAAGREAHLHQRAQMLHNRLNTIVENMPVGAALLGMDGRVIHSNPAFRRFLTQSDPPLCLNTESWSSLDQHGRALDPSQYPRARALRGEVVHNQPFVHRPSGGAERHTLVSAIPIHDENDDITAIISIVVDNDAAVRSSQALADSEARLAAIFNSATVGLAQADPDGRFTLVNDRYCETVGRSRDELLTLRMQDITHHDDQAENLALFQRIAETGASCMTEHRYLRPDGSTVWVQNSISLVRDASGRDLGTLAATVDISQRKEAEAQISLLSEDSRSRLEEREALLRALPVGVFIAHDAQCAEITTNPAGAAILRIPDATNASKTGPARGTLPFRVLKDGVELSGRELPMQRAAQSNRSVMGEELDIQFADGRVTNLYEYAVPLTDSSGTVRGCVGVFVDITARKQAEQRQKLLLNELNHRVKNTLSIVQSIAAQTLRETPEPRAFKQAFAARLMTLSRAHNLLTRTAWQGAPLADVVDAALAPFRTDALKQFDISGPSILLEPHAAVTLSLALHELATNAAKYGALSTPAGCVHVAWSIDTAPGRTPLVELSWAESGGPTVCPPDHRGFGTRLVEASADQLGGKVTLKYPPEGFACGFMVPLPSIPQPEILTTS